MANVIKTKRFILRPYRSGDAADVAKNINNPKIAKGLATVPYPYSLNEAKKWLRKVVAANRKKSGKIIRAIVIDGEVVGSLGGDIHKDGHKMTFGYWLAERYWGQGIATEAVKAFTDYYFKKNKLKRVEAEVFLFNKASIRVLEKNGFQKEGTLRKNRKKGNRIVDTHIFAKIK